MTGRERDVIRSAIAALKTGDRAALASFANMLGVKTPWKRNTDNLIAATLNALVELKGEF